MTLDQIVDDYIFRWRTAARAEMRSFAKEKSLTAAIRRAALCRWPNDKRHEHQRRIPPAALEEAEKRLQAAANRLTKAADFTALHRTIEEEIGGILKIGPLTVYDVAHRIGAYLGKVPTLVYLHCGTKAGAATLGFKGDTLLPAQLPTAFSMLTAAEIEDCLCIYREELRGASGSIRSCRSARRGCPQTRSHPGISGCKWLDKC